MFIMLGQTSQSEQKSFRTIWELNSESFVQAMYVSFESDKTEKKILNFEINFF